MTSISGSGVYMCLCHRRGSECVCLPIRHRSGVMGPWDVYGPCSGGPQSASRYHIVGPGELTPAWAIGAARAVARADDVRMSGVQGHVWWV